jgi:hypothetical protein
MRDFPWLFATRKWKADKYFNKEFKNSHEAHLGADDKYTTALRNYMRLQSGDPNLIYASTPRKIRNNQRDDETRFR